MAIYNVTTYGATGNGTTDDTGSLQAAINAAQAAGGGEVYIPKGAYRTTSSLTIIGGAGITLEGDQWNSSQIRADHNVDTLVIRASQGIDIRRLGFTPMRAKAGGSEILMENSLSVSVDACNINDMHGRPYRGIEMVANGDQYKYWIENTEINGPAEIGILIGQRGGLVQDVWLRNIIVARSTNEGILVIFGSGIDCFNLEILNAGTKGFATYPAAGQYVKSMKLVNAIIDTCLADGMALLSNGGYVADCAFSNSWWSNNIGHGLYMSGNVNGMQFSNCQFLVNRLDGAFVDGNGVTNFIFDACQFKNNSVDHDGVYFGLNISDNVSRYTVTSCQSGRIGEFAYLNTQRGGYRIGTGSAQGIFANNMSVGPMITPWDLYSTPAVNTGNVYF